jgi:hypothetical protein
MKLWGFKKEDNNIEEEIPLKTNHSKSKYRDKDKAPNCLSFSIFRIK